MDEHGTVSKVNKAFTDAFGYTNEDIVGENFRLTFIEKDRRLNKPEMELQTVHTNGSAEDENYVLHKDGIPIWVSGENILVKCDTHTLFKVIQNINPQKQLERFLLESNEFIETIFDSIRDAALVIVDSMMRVIKVNRAFYKFFDIEKDIKEGSKLSELGNFFLSTEETKKKLEEYWLQMKLFEGKNWKIKQTQVR